MSYRYLDMDSLPTKSYFDYFCTMTEPHFGLTVNMDITAFRREIKEKDYPFFHTLIYRMMRALNSVPEMRQRILDGNIIEYDSCEGSYALALEDGSYCYCALNFDRPFEEFLPYAAKVKEEAKINRKTEDEGDVNRLVFISCIPWVTFTNVVQPVKEPNDSTPRVLFGKFFEQDGKILIPCSVLVHHGLVDGRRLSNFFLKFQKLLDNEK